MKKEPKSFLVVSRYNESVDWIKNLTDRYIIYNKGERLPNDFNQIMAENFGANQYDIFRFIYDNYYSLPDIITFLQGNPFDHCLPDRFYSLIYNESFTPIFGDVNYPSGEYSEINDSWYINQAWHKSKTCAYENFDQYAESIFEDYTHENILTFPPGSQIMVNKERCLWYTRNFWKKLMDIPSKEVGMNGGQEAHVIERSIQLIFENKYKERNYDGPT